MATVAGRTIDPSERGPKQTLQSGDDGQSQIFRWWALLAFFSVHRATFLCKKGRYEDSLAYFATQITVAKTMKQLLSIILMSMFSLSAHAAPEAELWPYWEASNESSTRSIDHSAWDVFLQNYLVTNSHPYRLRYKQVSNGDHQALTGYINMLQSQDPRELSRIQQLAYWINLYNAATVALMLDHYPVASITKITSGLFSFGPWDKKLLNITGQEVTLNDIEHRILRPIFKDPRLHYAVNCASVGCPNLASRAYTATNANELMEKGARDYINDARGVAVVGGKLKVSSIYDWFAVDFGKSDAAVIQHLKNYANKELKTQLNRFDNIDDYHYDWSINDHS